MLNTSLGTTDVIWNLDDLYPQGNTKNIEDDISWCRKKATQIAKTYRGKVASLDAGQILQLVNQLEQLDSRLTKLATYSFLNVITQIDNTTASNLDQKISELGSECHGEIFFFELEWNKLEKSQAETLLADPVLAPYQHYLKTMRRYLPHQLSETEEKLLLDIAPVGRRSWTTLFEKIFGSLTFGEKNRSEEEVLSDLYSNDRTTRKKAATELTEGLKGQQHILTHIFNTLAAEKMISDRLRRHTSWVESMNLGNQLDNDTVETMITTITSSYDLVHRYYRVKKKLLGLETLYDYDRYAPLCSLPNEQIDWATAKGIVLDAFGAFSPQMAAIASAFFDKNWIHAPVIPGKRGGAFAHPAVPEVHPYVLVNYTGTLRDVSTLAHELGHGVHQVLAARQGHYQSDTPLVLAETASVFAELLVFTRQLDQIAEPAQRQAFVCQKLESIFATVFRQTAMNRFEQMMHDGRRQHGELSPEQFSEYWLATQREMFGDSVELSENYGIWWSYIPHFLEVPGYVYSYAFGELLVLALYNIYQKKGEAFVQGYLELLAAGGSKSPYDLVKPFGIKLNAPAFWQGGLDVVAEMVALVEE